MDIVLAVFMIAFLVLLGPVTLAFALWYASKKGWISHDWKRYLTAMDVYRGPGADPGLYWYGPVPDDHGQDADRVLLDDTE